MVVWSDGKTSFAGTIKANGGASGGDGGQVEVSGKTHLDFKPSGQVGTLAPQGKNGSLLLDPKNIIVAASNPGGTTATCATLADCNQYNNYATDTSWMPTATLVSLLNSSSITLQAATDLTVSSPVDAHLNTNGLGVSRIFFLSNVFSE